ncbi:MAG: hypothetical protein KJ736_10845 [Candidatus Omnitrophica bacterium]|nr:hypothetical protein [Candidatus Omnitrophota bacterium]
MPFIIAGENAGLILIIVPGAGKLNNSWAQASLTEKGRICPDIRHRTTMDTNNFLQY